MWLQLGLVLSADGGFKGEASLEFGINQLSHTVLGYIMVRTTMFF